MMTEELRQAMERAAQQSPQEQAIIAATVNQVIDGDARWEELLNDPQRLPALEAMAEDTYQEYLRGETQDLDELLAADEAEDKAGADAQCNHARQSSFAHFTSDCPNPCGVKRV